MDKDAIGLSTWSPDYAAGVSGNLYYYVSPQEGIVSTSFRERLWNGSHGSTRIVALAKNLNTGQSHPVGIIGNKGGQLLEDGHGALGNVFFELGRYGNDGYYASLPGGIYEVKFKLTAASWNDSSYRREIPVHLLFQLGEIHHVRQGQWSRNFSLETPSGGSSVYFYTPPQDGVATTGLSAPHRSIWNGGSGVTSLTATVFDAANNPHTVALKGYKAFYNRRIRMGDGVQRGFGQLLIEVDRGSASYQMLPAGDYRGKMTVVGAGWHDPANFTVEVDLGFTKEDPLALKPGAWSYLKQGLWSRNFSLETPSGGSSVYFYTPPQDGVATTGLSAPHRSIWNGGSGVTPITAMVFDAANNPHAVALKGYKAFYNRRIRMGDGVQGGFGQLLIEVDRGSASYQALPAGDYRGKMTVVGAGWHDGVLFPIEVDLGFTKEPVKPVRNPMEDFLRHTFFLRW